MVWLWLYVKRNYHWKLVCVGKYINDVNQEKTWKQLSEPKIFYIMHEGKHSRNYPISSHRKNCEENLKRFFYWAFYFISILEILKFSITSFEYFREYFIIFRIPTIIKENFYNINIFCVMETYVRFLLKQIDFCCIR